MSTESTFKPRIKNAAEARMLHDNRANNLSQDPDDNENSHPARASQQNRRARAHRRSRGFVQRNFWRGRNGRHEALDGSMHLAKHAAPTRAARQMEQSSRHAAEVADEIIARIVAAGCFDRPIDNYGTPHNSVAAHKAPIAAVPAIVAIVSHG